MSDEILNYFFGIWDTLNWAAFSYKFENENVEFFKGECVILIYSIRLCCLLSLFVCWIVHSLTVVHTRLWILKIAFCILSNVFAVTGFWNKPLDIEMKTIIKMLELFYVTFGLKRMKIWTWDFWVRMTIDDINKYVVR